MQAKLIARHTDAGLNYNADCAFNSRQLAPASRGDLILKAVRVVALLAFFLLVLLVLPILGVQ